MTEVIDLAMLPRLMVGRTHILDKTMTQELDPHAGKALQAANAAVHHGVSFFGVVFLFIFWIIISFVIGIAIFSIFDLEAGRALILGFASIPIFVMSVFILSSIFVWVSKRKD